jgi:hypothetical protein
MPLVLSLAPLIILYLYGVNLLDAYLPAAGSARLESLVVDTLLTGLVVYILAAGYWRRCHSTRLILAAWGVFLVTSLLDGWTALPMLALATPFALALLRLSRLPREVDGVLDGFDFIEMLALGLWQPKKRFEWPLFLLLVVLGGLALAIDAGGSIPAAAPIAGTPTPVDTSGPIGMVSLALGEEVEIDAAGQIALSGAGTRFSGVNHLYQPAFHDRAGRGFRMIRGVRGGLNRPVAWSAPRPVFAWCFDVGRLDAASGLTYPAARGLSGLLQRP